MNDGEIARFIQKLKTHRYDPEKAYGLILEARLKPSMPLAEIITVIKYEMPELFQDLKRRSKTQPGLALMFELYMDYGQAKERLGI